MNLICHWIFSDVESIKALPPYKEKALPAHHLDELKDMYSLLYPSTSMYLTPFHTVSGRLSFQGSVLGYQLNGRSYQTGSVIVANWPRLDENGKPTQHEELVAGTVLYYLSHSLLLKDVGTKMEHTLLKQRCSGNTPPKLLLMARVF